MWLRCSELSLGPPWTSSNVLCNETGIIICHYFGFHISCVIDSSAGLCMILLLVQFNIYRLDGEFVECGCFFVLFFRENLHFASLTQLLHG